MEEDSLRQQLSAAGGSCCHDPLMAVAAGSVRGS